MRNRFRILVLAAHGSHRCRLRLASGERTPSAALEVLLRDPSSEVAAEAVKNQNLSRATLAMWQLTH